MRLHRFYVDQEINNRTEFVIHSSELVNQVRRVFRLKVGDSLVVFNGTGFDYECKIDGFGKENKIDSDNTIRLSVASVSRSRYTPTNNLYLCAAVVKKDNFEWIVEKSTELGVTDIFPIAAEHSEKKSLNENRLKKIAIEASEQSGRGDAPRIHAIMGLAGAVEFFKQKNVEMIVFHTEGERYQESQRDKPVAVFIGPEGGWSSEELNIFHKHVIMTRSLGPQVLRAETAVIAALSVVIFGT